MNRCFPRRTLLVPIIAACIFGPLKADPKNSPSGLVEGPIKISFKQGSQKNKFGPSEEVKLINVWSDDRNKGVPSPYDWLKKQYFEESTSQLHLMIESTSYTMLIIDGVVRPFLLFQGRDGKRELWKIDGLESCFSRASIVEPTRAKLTLARWLGDAHSRLTLDFSDGFKITYDEKFHGP